MIIHCLHKALSLSRIHYADNKTLSSKGNNLDELTDFTNNEKACKNGQAGLCQIANKLPLRGSFRQKWSKLSIFCFLLKKCL